MCRCVVMHMNDCRCSELLRECQLPESWDYEAVRSRLVWRLGTELGSSVRTASAFNFEPISAIQPLIGFFDSPVFS